MIPLVPLVSTAEAIGLTDGPEAVSVYMNMHPPAGLVLVHFFKGTEDWPKNSRSVPPFRNSVRGEQPMPGFPGMFWWLPLLMTGGLLVLSVPVAVIGI